MSGSRISLRLDYAMIDGRIECNPEMADWSGGHMFFKFGPCKTRCRGPASWTFDELYEPYDREKVVKRYVDELRAEIASGAGEQLLTYMIGNLLDQAKAHCDERHQEYRKQPFPGRKGH